MNIVHLSVSVVCITFQKDIEISRDGLIYTCKRGPG